MTYTGKGIIVARKYPTPGGGSPFWQGVRLQTPAQSASGYKSRQACGHRHRTAQTAMACAKLRWPNAQPREHLK